MNTACSGRPSGRLAKRTSRQLAAPPDPWEVARPDEAVEIKLGCSFEITGGSLRVVPGRPSTLIGIPFDRPVVGYGGKTVNTPAALGAAAPDYFDFQEFSSGISSAPSLAASRRIP